MSPLQFAAEMEGVFAGTADMLLPPALIDRQSLDFAHVELDGLRGPARYALGCDWGWSSDRTAATVAGRLVVDGPPVFAAACARAWPSGFENARAIEEVRASPAPFAWAVSKTNGLGAPLTRDLFSALRRRPVEAGGRRRCRVTRSSRRAATALVRGGRVRGGSRGMRSLPAVSAWR